MSQNQSGQKKRKKKVSKGQTLAARRQADKVRRDKNRPKAKRKREEHRAFKFRVKVVRLYRALKQRMAEKDAVQAVFAKYEPKEAWHFKLSVSTIRRWHRLVGPDNKYAALRPQSTRPDTIHYQVPELGMVHPVVNWAELFENTPVALDPLEGTNTGEKDHFVAKINTFGLYFGR